MKSFDFIIKDSNNLIYTAESKGDYFWVYRKDTDTSQGSQWGTSQVVDNLAKLDWLVLEKKQPLFSIKEGSIESAARFIVANNNYQPYTNIVEAEKDIKHYIYKMVEEIKAGKESYYLSTAGWTIVIGQEDEDYYVVEVLVDPSVSQDREFVNVEEVI